MVQAEFQVWDYVLFSTLLVFSLAVGMFYAYRGGKQKTTSDFLMGNRELKLIPVSISLLVSFLSAILLLGFPAESYNNGFEFVLNAFGMSLGCFLAAAVFVPLLYPLHLTSSFEVSKMQNHTIMV